MCVQTNVKMTEDLSKKLLDLYGNKIKEQLKYQEIAEKNLDDLELAIQQSQEKCKRFEDTIENVKELSKTARSKSYLKICSLAYVEAFVKHTGEYNVELGSNYQATLTKEQTIEYLEEQLAGEKGILNAYKNQREEIQRRLGYDFTEYDDVPDVSDMPDSVMSDKGMAFKQGNFFEIVEEDDVPYVKGKRISRVHKKIEKQLADIKLDDVSDAIDVSDRAEAFLNFIEKLK